MRASRRNGKMVKRSIPWPLHMAVIRLQGAEELEYVEACVRAAVLIEEGGEKFKEAVNAEANRLYKSRFMVELNKAKNTWHQKGYDDGVRDGKAAGYDIGSEANQIRYPCSVCGEDMILLPEGEDTKAAIEFLKSHGWRHGHCSETSKPRG